MDIYMEESNNKSTYWNCLFILKGCRSTIDTNTWWRVYSICAYRICVQTACIYCDFHLKSKTMVGWWWRARECAHRKSNWKSVAQDKRDNDKSIRIECMWHAKYAWVPTIGQGNYHTIILNWRNDISKHTHTHHSSADAQWGIWNWILNLENSIFGYCLIRCKSIRVVETDDMHWCDDEHCSSLKLDSFINSWWRMKNLCTAIK